jgi:hypothetical protein
MPRIRRVLVDVTGMLAIPKGRGKVPHGHRGDIFCNEKKKKNKSRQCSVSNAPARALLMVRAAKKRAASKHARTADDRLMRESVRGGTGAEQGTPLLLPPE